MEKSVFILYISCEYPHFKIRGKKEGVQNIFFYNFFCLRYMNRFNSLKHMQQFDHLIILIKRKKEIKSKKYAFLFISNTSTSNTQGSTSLKLAKNQAKARQHPEVKLLVSENHLLHPR